MARANGVQAPDWTRDVVPLDKPYFATPLRSLRSYLLRVSPVAFKRHNLFVDATVGRRVSGQRGPRGRYGSAHPADCLPNATPLKGASRA